MKPTSQNLEQNLPVYWGIRTSSIFESLHTIIVIFGRVDVVYTNGVGADRLHQLGIVTALCGIDEWILGNQLVRDTYV